jgi:hypothetical protein
MKVQGSCHCGSIKHEAEVDPAHVTICHCSDCQRLSGSAFRVSVRALQKDFVLLAGSPSTYVKTADSAAKRAQVFCSRCASALYTYAIDNTETYGLGVGCIEQRRELIPTASCMLAVRPSTAASRRAGASTSTTKNIELLQLIAKHGKERARPFRFSISRGLVSGKRTALPCRPTSAMTASERPTAGIANANPMGEKQTLDARSLAPECCSATLPWPPTSRRNIAPLQRACACTIALTKTG